MIPIIDIMSDLYFMFNTGINRISDAELSILLDITHKLNDSKGWEYIKSGAR